MSCHGDGSALIMSFGMLSSSGSSPLVSDLMQPS